MESDTDGPIVGLIESGCSPAEAIDYHAVEQRGLTQTEWADHRGVDQSTVSENVAKAREKLGEDG